MQSEVGAQGRGGSSLVFVVRLFLVHHLHFIVGRKKWGKSIKCRNSTLESMPEPQAHGHMLPGARDLCKSGCNNLTSSPSC